MTTASRSMTTAPSLKNVLTVARQEFLESGVAEALCLGLDWPGLSRISGEDVAQASHATSKPQFIAALGRCHRQQVFDLASISKTVTAVGFARLVELGEFTYQSKLEQYWPELSGTPGGSSSFEELLSHRSPLRPHVELFARSWQGFPIRREELFWQAASACREPGSEGPLRNDAVTLQSAQAEERAPLPALYSDLGYLLTGELLRKRYNKELEALWTELLFEPLGLELGSARMWQQESSVEFVRTERQVGRGAVLLGQVHDDNAWAIGGLSLCGHAGLFGTVQGVLDWGKALLEGAQGRGLLARVLPHMLLPRPGGSLLLGFDRPSGGTSSAGRLASSSCFGHLGYTGTSLWCDPEREAVTVLLSNRVYPFRSKTGIQAARQRTQDALLDLCSAAMGSTAAIGSTES